MYVCASVYMRACVYVCTCTRTHIYIWCLTVPFIGLKYGTEQSFQIYRPVITTVKNMKCCPLKKYVLVCLVKIVYMEMI